MSDSIEGKDLTFPLWAVMPSKHTKTFRWIHSGKLGLAEILVPLYTSEKTVKNYIAKRTKRGEFEPFKITDPLHLLGLLVILEKLEFRYVCFDHTGSKQNTDIYPIAGIREQLERDLCS